MPNEDYDGFPMSIIVVGFFVTSLAYLICFCCCIIQFFIRRGREITNGRNGQSQNPVDNSKVGQKNDTLKRRFMKQFQYSLRRFKQKRETEKLQIPTQINNKESCPICFEEYTGDPAEILMGVMKKCQHYFHFDCIWTWLENRGNCPLCREKVTLNEEDIKACSLRHIQTKEVVPGSHAAVSTTVPGENPSETKTDKPAESSSTCITVDNGHVNEAFQMDTLDSNSSNNDVNVPPEISDEAVTVFVDIHEEDRLSSGLNSKTSTLTHPEAAKSTSTEYANMDTNTEINEEYINGQVIAIDEIGEAHT